MIGRPDVRPLPSPSRRRTGLPFRDVFLYGSGNFAFALLGLVVAVNLQFFYTDYVGLSAGLVSWSLLFARLFDGVTDPLMAYLSDRTRSRVAGGAPTSSAPRCRWAWPSTCCSPRRSWAIPRRTRPSCSRTCWASTC